MSVEPARTSGNPSLFPSALGPGPGSVAQDGRLFCSSCRICRRARVKRTGGSSFLAVWPGTRRERYSSYGPWLPVGVLYPGGLRGRLARLSAVLLGHLDKLDMGRVMAF